MLYGAVVCFYTYNFGNCSIIYVPFCNAYVTHNNHMQGKVFENGATSGYDFARWGPRWFNHEASWIWFARMRAILMFRGVSATPAGDNGNGDTCTPGVFATLCENFHYSVRSFLKSKPHHVRSYKQLNYTPVFALWDESDCRFITLFAFAL